jgi:hypothetical protein
MIYPVNILFFFVSRLRFCLNQRDAVFREFCINFVGYVFTWKSLQGDVTKYLASV